MIYDRVICSRCGHVGCAQDRQMGSELLEIVLWICGLLPGLIYSIWRASSHRLVCSSCGSEELAPIDSPKGGQMWEAMELYKASKRQGGKP